MRHIRQVEPGSLTAWQNRTESSRRFWRPRRSYGFRRLDEAVDAFLPLFDRVVSDQLVSDVPVESSKAAASTARWSPGPWRSAASFRC